MLLPNSIVSDANVVSASALLFVFVAVLVLRRRRSSLPLPPGPTGRFLVGNLWQLSEQLEQDFITWGKQYDSDVIHIKVLGQHMIGLNSVEAATDLLDKRGSNYSDRPRFTLFEVMGWGLTLTFLRWGPRWKIHRRLFQTTLTQSAIKTFRPMQTQEAHKAVRSLLAAPQDWRDTTLLLTTSIIFRIAYGQEVKSSTSPYTAMAEAANKATTNGGIAGSTIVDIFPLARYVLPSCLSPALRHARQSRVAIRTIHDIPWGNSLRDIEAGTAAPSFMKKHYETWTANAKTGTPQETTLDDLKGATAAVFIAGGNSTWGTILTLMLFLTKHRGVQQRVRDELDAVVGLSRLPTFDDRPVLTYFDAFMQECMRVLPLNPLVIPHCTLQDDVYKGVFIPAGSMVFANTKAMSSDPATYRDPEVFDPDRFLERGEPFPTGNFGFGRRKCPGNHLALASVYIFIATLISVFELDKVVDCEGKVLEPEAALTVGLGGHPTDYECQLKLRSPERAKILQDLQAEKQP
ncbi:cytochrome p450 monooxygenase [Coniella lustricola]|uniref:Cytochrome p450 monooxygenase n=1 Tax=Coniella lustricola TaxID=2025994 RepID=A0A2T3A133_9PEZI|nr:cytochrome p450 monooxygenase [Coniella lustricola]